MVFSELAAATLIAICGLKNSYRIILKGERVVRRTIKLPAPALAGYKSFPRIFIRRIFRAGLVIVNRWEGRAKNAAQIASDTRSRAKRASSAVAKRAGDVRNAAQDVRERAQKARLDLRDKVQQRMAPKSSDSRSSTSSRKFSSSSTTSTAHINRSVGLGQINDQHTSTPCVRTRY